MQFRDGIIVYKLHSRCNRTKSREGNLRLELSAACTVGNNSKINIEVLEFDIFKK